MKRLFTLLTALFLSFNFATAQLNVTTGLDTIQLANLLTGLGVNIYHVQINCHPDAYGEFTGTSEIPITHGLMMTTGVIDSVLLGPNNLTNAGVDNTYPGDADLTADAGTATYNACVLEFDCIPSGDTLEFNFGFGSEEYPEYVGAAFNDIFAIYLTDTANITVNAALIPSTTTPVAINNVNHLTNAAYYIDNSTGVNIQFDGLTQNLSAFAVVNPGSVYHFKIAIADASDGIYDSGVLLEAFSFRSMPANFDVESILSSTMVVFPNPANELIQIQSKTNLSVDRIEIADGLGKIFMSRNIQSTHSMVDVSELSAGIYILTGYTSQGKFTKKILIQ